jgi:hypothetical protein
MGRNENLREVAVCTSFRDIFISRLHSPLPDALLTLTILLGIRLIQVGPKDRSEFQIRVAKGSQFMAKARPLPSKCSRNALQVLNHQHAAQL